VKEPATANAEDDLSRRLAELKSRGWWWSRFRNCLFANWILLRRKPRVSICTRDSASISSSGLNLNLGIISQSKTICGCWMVDWILKAGFSQLLPCPYPWAARSVYQQSKLNRHRRLIMIFAG
jgi:hypothetical protein